MDADILIKSCALNLTPVNEAFYKFMFDRCNNLKEQEYLLDLYTELFNRPLFDKNAFEIAIKKKQIVNYIIFVYNNYNSNSYQWYKHNILRFLL
jgi:hypothetical protein